MATKIDNTVHLKGQAVTLVKQFIVYDGVGRPSEVYTAETGAGNGKTCTKTTYQYINATSSNVERMKEENSVWDSTWDVV